MPELTYRDALRAGMAEEMERDESVVILGEDIGLYGGTHLITDGLLDRFGPKRVMDTPIAEGGFTGAAIGMAMGGLRPIVEMMTWNFSFQAVDQIIQNAAKLHYFSGGQVNVPLVIRGPNGGGVQRSATRTRSSSWRPARSTVRKARFQRVNSPSSSARRGSRVKAPTSP